MVAVAVIVLVPCAMASLVGWWVGGLLQEQAERHYQMFKGTRFEEKYARRTGRVKMVSGAKLDKSGV